MPSVEQTQLIATLDLEPHLEGGFFRRSFESSHRPKLNINGADRFAMTSIYYMLTSAHPLGALHKNKSDIMHVHNKGSALRYHLLHADGHLETIVLGANVEAGENMQMVVKGGTWKATELVASDNYDYGLITEVVVPGFDYDDMQIASEKDLAMFGQHATNLRKFIPGH